jgi:hypothetical protein
MTSINNGDETTGTTNEQYDLISVLYHALEGAATYEVYIQDAEEAEDDELIEFFSQLQEEDYQRAERAKHLLAKRITQQPAGVR